MEAAIASFLKEDLGLDDTAIAALGTSLDAAVPRVTEFRTQRATLAADRDRIAAAETAVTTANNRLNDEIAEWTRVKASGGEVTAQMQRDLEAANAKLATATTRLRAVATQAGLDPNTVVQEFEASVTPPPARPAATPATPDLTGYVRADQLAPQLAGLTDFMITLPAELATIAQEHFDLTGERLDTRTIVQTIKTRASDKHNQKPVDPRAIWEEAHGIPAKRQAKSKADHDAEIAAAVEQGRQEARSQQAIPSAHPGGKHAIVFQNDPRTNQPHASVLTRQAGQNRISAAASALATHRYRKSA